MEYDRYYSKKEACFMFSFTDDVGVEINFVHVVSEFLFKR